eukprot:5130630-Pyramimonas_sp.AAC.1
MSGASGGHLGCFGDPPDASWGPLGGLLGASWRLLGRLLGSSWSALGSFRGALLERNTVGFDPVL